MVMELYKINILMLGEVMAIGLKETSGELDVR